MTPVADPLRAHARTQPNAPALVTPDAVWTYAAFDGLVEALTSWLHDHGITNGERMALYQPPSAGYVALLWAALRAGLTVAPLNTRQPVAALPALLDRIACRTLVSDTVEALPPAIHRLSFPTVAPATLSGLDVALDVDLDTPWTILFTSGSSGTPKAALLTWGNHWYSALGSAAHLPLQPGDRWLLDLPLYHVGGLSILVRCLQAGAAAVLPASGHRLAETLRAATITHVSLVATQFQRLLADDPAPPPALRAVLLGGSALPASLLADGLAAGWPLHTTYGLTEMASQVATTPHGADLATLHTAGPVLPYRELRLSDTGEVLVRGATRFAGYLEGTRLVQPFDADGWYATGDRAVWVDAADGPPLLRILGRTDFLIISGGENIQPEEVEAALLALPGVSRAAVVGVPDATYGQRPVAFVEAALWTPDAWRAALTRSLPRYKVPDAFLPWPQDVAEGFKTNRALLAKRAIQHRS